MLFMDDMNNNTLNIDKAIFSKCGSTLGSTLYEVQKPLTVEPGSTLSTLLKPSLQNTCKKGVKCKSMAQDTKISVLSVLPTPPDSDNVVCKSVLPCVLPVDSEALPQGSKVMLLIAEYHKRYNIESDHAFNVIAAKIEDQGYDPKLIDDCILRYRQGHRVFVPLPESHEEQ